MKRRFWVIIPLLLLSGCTGANRRVNSLPDAQRSYGLPSVVAMVNGKVIARGTLIQKVVDEHRTGALKDLIDAELIDQACDTREIDLSSSIVSRRAQAEIERRKANFDSPEAFQTALHAAGHESENGWVLSLVSKDAWRRFVKLELLTEFDRRRLPQYWGWLAQGITTVRKDELVAMGAKAEGNDTLQLTAIPLRLIPGLSPEMATEIERAQTGLPIRRETDPGQWDVAWITATVPANEDVRWDFTQENIEKRICETTVPIEEKDAWMSWERRHADIQIPDDAHRKNRE